MSNEYAQQAGTATSGGYGGEPLYYYTLQGATAGPVPMITLAGLVTTGQLGRDDLVWADGDAVSTAAADMPALAHLFGGQPLSYQTPPTPVATYANFWQRFVAVVVDSVIVGVGNLVVGFAIGLVVGAALAGSSNRNEAVQLASALGNVIGIITSWLYFALFESSASRATPGKMAMGLIVVDQQGNRIGFGRATGRYFGKFLSYLTLFIGFLMVIWTEKKQALHDMLAGTLVLKK